MKDMLKNGLDIVRSMLPQDDVPIETKYQQYLNTPQAEVIQLTKEQMPNYGLEEIMYASADGFPQEKPENKKKGTGRHGKAEDLYQVKNSTPGSDEHLEAINRLRANEYDLNPRFPNPVPYDGLPPDSITNIETLVKDLGYKTKDQLMDDVNSRDISVKFELGKKLYETGKSKDNIEYLNLALMQFGWLADQKGSMSDDMIYDVAKNLFDLTIYYAEQNDVEGQIASLKYQLKLYPGNPKTIRLLKELGTQ